ncbi:MAG: insulinase family protein [Alphaproteobacteria bacterium]|nr:insulinase family protein [Alphaproteobacteria bacterium]MCB9792118.1 insulinase family protein [Alphaproteobacteria bacterium]
MWRRLLPLTLALPALAWAEPLSIPYEMYTLDNGLTVILSEDHSVPVVQVNVWYHVGSRDEVEGRTGFAHLFEHLMFQGSLHNDGDYFEALQEVGGRVNGSTNTDRTNYFEGVPSEYLPLALWGEADRMGFMLDVLTAERMSNQQDVVRNERRQRYENRPYGSVWVDLLANVFPEGHPYHHPTIGNHEDLEAATLEDVKAFFRTWYLPNNASLVVAGDFEPEKAKELIELYFGQIPAGEQPPETAAPEVTPLAEVIEVRKTEAGVPHKKLWLAWRSPALYEAGDAELDLLSSLLTDGKDSRLTQALVIDQQIAKEVSAYQVSMDLGSMYVIEATAAEGHDTDELIAAIDAVLAELAESGPTAEEIEVGVTNYEARFVNSLSTVAAKADRLNGYYTKTGEPDYSAQDLQRYLDATPEVVQQTMNTWLVPERLELHIWPEEGE